LATYFEGKYQNQSLNLIEYLLKFGSPRI